MRMQPPTTMTLLAVAFAMFVAGFLLAYAAGGPHHPVPHTLLITPF